MDPRNAGQYRAPAPPGGKQYVPTTSGQYAEQPGGWAPGVQQPAHPAQPLPQSSQGMYAPQPGADPYAGHQGPAAQGPYQSHGGPRGMPGNYAPGFPGGYSPGYAHPNMMHHQPAGVPGMPGAPMLGQNMPGASFMSNPFSMFNTVANMGQNMQAGQQYVQNKVTWFTGGLFQQTFHVDSKYVKSKVLLLLAPFLRSYDYIRTSEAVSGHIAMKPPKHDLYAPDLYIPLLSMLTYVVMVAATKFMNGAFKPDVMYNTFTWASTSWTVNFCIMWVITRAMALATPPSSLEISAYSGYAFVYYSATMLVGWALGRGLAWYAAWLYTSFCMAAFLIRTYKQTIRMDAALRGVGAGKSSIYLLLILGLVQCALAWLMGVTVHTPHAAAKVATGVAG